jgi:hypothetical protein
MSILIGIVVLRCEKLMGLLAATSRSHRFFDNPAGFWAISQTFGLSRRLLKFASGFLGLPLFFESCRHDGHSHEHVYSAGSLSHQRKPFQDLLPLTDNIIIAGNDWRRVQTKYS